MFTGIIEKVVRIGRIKKEGRGISIHLQLPFDVKEGDSVSVNGVCLTVNSIYGRTSIFRAMEETLQKTNLSMSKPGNWVNIERSLRVGDSINGHIIYGHIDGLGRLSSIRKTPSSTELKIEYPPVLAKYIAKKGSVALDGISLTVVDVSPLEFQVAIIPYTKDKTNIQYRKKGDWLNIEIDPLARYIERIREARYE